MIVYRTGDLLEAFEKGDVNIMVHGVNTKGKMNSGIAKQIRAKYPSVFKSYKESLERSEILCKDPLGSINRVGIDNKIILNMFTQPDYGYDGDRYVDYEAIYNGFKTLINHYGHPSNKIGIPKIGAGLAGGDWDIIEIIINGIFTENDIYCYVLEEKKDEN